MRNALLIVSLFLIGPTGLAQTSFVVSTGERIQAGSEVLDRAFEGGLRNAQFQEIDLNSDGVDDLLVFDRSAQKLFTYLLTNGSYVYAPGYEQFFPEDIVNWLVLVDFDCDGRKDLFTSSLFGMSLFKNITSGATPGWELVYETVFTEGSNGPINLQVNGGDYPAITDVDNDGDIDILVFDFAVGGGIQYHQNMSMENTGSCGLDLERVTRRFGDFEECTCETYIFGSELCADGGRIEHSGGKTVLNYDLNGSGVNDLVIGQEYCDLSGFLENQGTNQSADFNTVSFSFPNSDNPVTMEFPAYFMIDVDGDGDKDIVAAPNSVENTGTIDFASSNLLYVNEPDGYVLQTRAFLQEDMLDLGVNAKPALSDIDLDGDADLIIASGAHSRGARIVLLRNQGSSSNPQFELTDDDFLSFESSRFEDLALQAIDLNNDGLDDLVIMKKGLDMSWEIFWHTGNFIEPYSEENSTPFDHPAISFGDQMVLEDVDKDGNYELFIGRVEGNLSYFQNKGSLQSPEWTLVSDSFLDIGENFNARNLHITFDDFNNDEKRDLLVYNDLRNLYLVNDYSGSAIKSDRLIYDSLTNTAYDHQFGRNAYPASGPIYGDEKSVLIGLSSGGVNLLRNVNSSSSEGNIPIRVNLYPNPLSASANLKIIANQNLDVVILDTKGNLLSDGLKINKLEETELALDFLRQGLYILRFENVIGEKISRKIILTK